MASSGGGRSKRHRQSTSCTESDDGDMIGPVKRCGVSLSPRCAGTDGDKGDSEDMYEYDDEGDTEQTKDEASSACDTETEKRYVVLTGDVLRARQEADTARVAEVLSISPGFAAVLLRHFNWRVGRVQDEWFSDDRRFRGAVGLPPGDGALVATARSPWPCACAICFDGHPAGRTRSAACAAHYYCDGCWRGYVSAAVGDGPRCLSLRCPDPSCPAPVVRELVDQVVGAADRARYERFWLRSYVEESGGRTRWCPGPGCTSALEWIGCAPGGDDAAADAFCACGHGFCWLCGEEAHRPVRCGTVRAWLAKNSSDSETANWVLTNTKHCPKCRRPIEKNQGCNHMTCGAPCRHQFCWLCLDPWDDHRGCSRYDSRRLLRAEVDGAGKSAGGHAEEERRRREAKASLDRYLYHYERWAGNGKSLRKALADTDLLERSELERMAEAVGSPATALGFVAEAYRQVADGRRVLRWAHAYGYFLDPERDAAKRGLFDDLQSQANRWLECLHGAAELERKELFGASNGESPVAAEAFRAYREKVANLTGVTRKFLRNLVEAFETDLPEVVTKPAFVPQIVNGPTTMGRQTVGAGGIISAATVSDVSYRGISALQASSSSLISLEANIGNDSVQEHKPMINPAQQPVRPDGHGSLLSNPSQVWLMNSAFLGGGSSTMGMGLPNIGATPLQVRILNVRSSGVTSTSSVISSSSGPVQPIGNQQMVQSTPLGFFGSNSSTMSGNSNIDGSSSKLNSMGMGQSLKPVQQGLMTSLQLGQGGIGEKQNVIGGLGPTTLSLAPGMMPTSGMDQQTAVNSLGVTNNSATNVHIGQDPNFQQAQPNYVKFWEGTLSGIKQGQPLFICRLEGYRSGTTSEKHAEEWPENMQIARLIAQEYMHNKQYVGRADILVFRTLNQHGFLQQLQEKRLCAVIQLPSQTLILSMSDKESRMIGMVFPGEMTMFEPQRSTQQPPLQQQHLSMQPQGLPLQGQPHAQMQPMLQQQEQPPKYVKIWEGSLSGQRQGQPVFICKLEGYSNGTTSGILAAEWPDTMRIVRLIAQEHMNNKEYVGKANFLVFRTLSQHGFLHQIREKKLCAMISLPSQTLLLSMSDKESRMIGMLFPGDFVVIKAQVSTEQPTIQQQPLQ